MCFQKGVSPCYSTATRCGTAQIETHDVHSGPVLAGGATGSLPRSLPMSLPSAIMKGESEFKNLVPSF